MSEDDQLVDTFPKSPNAAVANQQGGRYHRHQKFTHDNTSQDVAVNIIVSDIEMYGLFCGFKDGFEVASFALNRMAYELFQEQPISSSLEPHQVIEQLTKKFLSVNRRYENELNNLLSEICILGMEPAELDEAKMAYMTDLRNKVKAGCTVLIVLRIRDDLYILNCGTSQALVFTDSQQVVRLIEAVHDSENPEEIQRLTNIGVEPSDVSAPTRAIGDGYRSVRYDEEPEFKNATKPPVICEPEIYQTKIQPGWRHLILVSGGLVQNIKDYEADDISMELYELFREQSTIERTASTLVFNVAEKHKDAYEKHVKESPETTLNNHREEMTLIYVRLQDAPSIINTIDSSINSTLGSLISIEPETWAPYVDLSPKRAGMVSKDLEKYLASSNTAQSQ